MDIFETIEGAHKRLEEISDQAGIWLDSDALMTWWYRQGGNPKSDYFCPSYAVTQGELGFYIRAGYYPNGYDPTSGGFTGVSTNKLAYEPVIITRDNYRCRIETESGVVICDDEISPSLACKSAGLKSLAELVQITGVSEQTLINWHRNKPKLFAVVVAGAVVKQPD